MHTYAHVEENKDNEESNVIPRILNEEKDTQAIHVCNINMVRLQRSIISLN